MLSFVYACGARIKGYTHKHVKVAEDLSETDRNTFYDNMMREGLRAVDNVVVIGKSWICTVFDEKGKVLYEHTEKPEEPKT